MDINSYISNVSPIRHILDRLRTQENIPHSDNKELIHVVMLKSYNYLLKNPSKWSAVNNVPLKFRKKLDKCFEEMSKEEIGEVFYRLSAGNDLESINLLIIKLNCRIEEDLLTSAVFRSVIYGGSQLCNRLIKLLGFNSRRNVLDDVILASLTAERVPKNIEIISPGHLISRNHGEYDYYEHFVSLLAKNGFTKLASDFVLGMKEILKKDVEAALIEVLKYLLNQNKPEEILDFIETIRWSRFEKELLIVRLLEMYLSSGSVISALKILEKDKINVLKSETIDRINDIYINDLKYDLALELCNLLIFSFEKERTGYKIILQLLKNDINVEIKNVLEYLELDVEIFKSISKAVQAIKILVRILKNEDSDEFEVTSLIGYIQNIKNERKENIILEISAIELAKNGRSDLCFMVIKKIENNNTDFSLYCDLAGIFLKNNDILALKRIAAMDFYYKGYIDRMIIEELLNKEKLIESYDYAKEITDLTLRAELLLKVKCVFIEKDQTEEIYSWLNESNKMYEEYTILKKLSVAFAKTGNIMESLRFLNKIESLSQIEKPFDAKEKILREIITELAKNCHFKECFEASEKLEQKGNKLAAKLIALRITSRDIPQKLSLFFENIDTFKKDHVLMVIKYLFEFMPYDNIEYYIEIIESLEPKDIYMEGVYIAALERVIERFDNDIILKLPVLAEKIRNSTSALITALYAYYYYATFIRKDLTNAEKEFTLEISKLLSIEYEGIFETQ